MKVHTEEIAHKNPKTRFTGVDNHIYGRLSTSLRDALDMNILKKAMLACHMSHGRSY